MNIQDFGSLLMNKNEASVVLDEVLRVLEDTNLGKYSVIQSMGKSGDYSVCVKAFLGIARKQQLEIIARKHKLKMSEEPQALVLY